MSTKEFEELAKALYEPMKQMAHIMKEMDIEGNICLWAQKGNVEAEGGAMEGWSLRFQSDIGGPDGKWSAQHRITLSQDFFLSIDEDLPYDPEDAA